jgi:hypothetical protein
MQPITLIRQLRTRDLTSEIAYIDRKIAHASAACDPDVGKLQRQRNRAVHKLSKLASA